MTALPAVEAKGTDDTSQVTCARAPHMALHHQPVLPEAAMPPVQTLPLLQQAEIRTDFCVVSFKASFLARTSCESSSGFARIAEASQAAGAA